MNRIKSADNPLLTVGVACYNIEGYVERCMRSVCAQTYAHMEILVVDDGSTDGTGELLDQIAAQDEKVRVIHQENRGLGGARNTVLREAKGEYIAFVDGDDTIAPEMYEVMIGVALKYDADVVSCDIDRVYEEAGASTGSATGIDGASTGSATGGDDSVDGNRTVRTLSVSKGAHEDTLGASTGSATGGGGAEDGASTGSETVTRLSTADALTAILEERAEIGISHCAWNKVYKRTLTDAALFPEKKKYEDIAVIPQWIAKGETLCHVHRPLYRYLLDRTGSIMNEGLTEAILTDQLPAYHERRDFFERIGREDLVDLSDYQVIKRMLLFYTEARRSKDAKKRAMIPAFAGEVETARGRVDRIYSCSVATRGEKLRTQLFLMHPFLYNRFTDVNDFRISLVNKK